MKADEWIQIAGVIAAVLLAIATFAGPVYAAQLSQRSQSKPSPQPRPHWLARVLRSPWFQSPWRLPPLLIVTALASLVAQLHSNAPLTRRAVFDIVWDAGGVFWGALCVLASLIVQVLESQENRSVALRKLIKNMLGLLDSQEENFQSFSRGVLDVLPEMLDYSHSSVERLNIATEKTVNDIYNRLALIHEDLDKARDSKRSTKGFGG